MEYFVDAKINFKGDCDLDAVREKINEELEEYVGFEENSYELNIPEKGKLEVILYREFEFYWVEPLVQAVISAGLKKFGRDKLIAYQTAAECYFKNYVTKDGRFLDFCGDCAY